MIDLYKDLITRILENKNEFSEEDLVVFPSMKGDEYNNKLMIIGRAVNDWIHTFNKNDLSSWENIKNGLANELGSGDFRWVEERWIDPKDHYNPRKSAFWRVARRLSEKINCSEEAATKKIVYSNLYKVAKEGGGNPSERLATVQFENCKRILIEEFDEYKPANVVFLTGKNWAKEFFIEMPLSNYKEHSNELVYITANYKETKLIVVDHPQGKRESDIIENVLKYV